MEHQKLQLKKKNLKNLIYKNIYLKNLININMNSFDTNQYSTFANTPKSATPKSATPKSASPKSDIPKMAPLKSDTPKSDTPKSDTHKRKHFNLNKFVKRSFGMRKCPPCDKAATGRYIYSVFHSIMALLAIYLSFRCNNGFSLGPFFIALLCPYIYIIYIVATKGTCGIFEKN